MTSSGAQPNPRATLSRADSMIPRAARPAKWSEEGFAYSFIASAAAATASPQGGAVAAESK